MTLLALPRPLLLPTPSTVRQSGIIELGYKKISSTIQLVGAGGHWLRAWQDPPQSASLWSTCMPTCCYFASKLSQLSNSSPIPTLQDDHISLFSQFQLKVSHVWCILSSFDTTKFIGDDNVSPCVLKSRALPLCGLLTALFRRICYSVTFPTSWKISRITPIYKKGARSDPINYRPIVVLPTLSHIFEQLLITHLQRPLIFHQQFGFLKGSTCRCWCLTGLCYYHCY